jgi:CubicO group peptidase (beta-lactamase class C family)
MRPSALLLLVPAIFATLTSNAAPQTGHFDLEKTKTVVSGLIEQAIKDRGVPSVSIALVRGDSIVWKAAFGYADVRTKTPGDHGHNLLHRIDLQVGHRHCTHAAAGARQVQA